LRMVQCAMPMDLELRHLRVVVAVADSGGFTPAATRLHLAQSSVSRTVAEVEARLGTALFERTSRRLEVTVEGEEFITLARHLLAEFDRTMSHFSGYLAGTRGSVTVATLPSLAAVLLPPIAAAFRRSRPQVRLQIHDSLSREVLTRVKAGAADLAVTVLPGHTPDLEVKPVAQDRFFGVFSPHHEFADRHRLSWRELAGQPFIAFGQSSSIRPHVDRAVNEAAVPLGPITEAQNVAAVAGLTAAGLGVTALPALVLPMVEFAGLRAVELEEPVVQRTICVIRHTRRPMSRPAAEFMVMLSVPESHQVPLPRGAEWVGCR
jgi:LysR family carnitine catabolism transcriptional activator